MDQVAENARHLTLETAYKIEAVLQGVEKVPGNLAAVLQDYPYRQPDLLRLLHSVVSKQSRHLRRGGGLRTFRLYPQIYYFCPYCFRNTARFRSPSWAVNLIATFTSIGIKYPATPAPRVE